MLQSLGFFFLFLRQSAITSPGHIPPIKKRLVPACGLRCFSYLSDTVGAGLGLLSEKLVVMRHRGQGNALSVKV